MTLFSSPPTTAVLPPFEELRGKVKMSKRSSALVPYKTDLTTMELAESFAACGWFPDITKLSQAIVKIEYGRMLGIAPPAAIMGIFVIHGKPAPSAGLLTALVRARPDYNFKFVQKKSRRSRRTRIC